MRTNNRVTGVITRGGKLLLIHRFRDGDEYWVFPGGGVEEGEDFDTALKREILEETGLGLVAYAHLWDQLDEHGNTCIFYLCEVEEGEPTLGGPELEEQSPANQHLLEWVELSLLHRLANVYPLPGHLLDRQPGLGQQVAQLSIGIQAGRKGTLDPPAITPGEPPG